ncbi:MAG: alpha-galactosidase [Eubacterium sp.]|nr:alpha-galactosidase [Eubacterium sp.]
MSIEINEQEKIFILNTKHSTYMIKADDTGCLRHLYYGPSVPDKDLTFLQAGCDRGFSGNPYEKKLDRGYSFDTIPQEYSCHGTGDHRVYAAEAETEEGSRATDLRYESYRAEKGVYEPEGLPHVRPDEDAAQEETLRILMRDAVTDLTAELIYTVFSEKDVIERAVRLTNDSDRTLFLNKAASVCVDHQYGDFDIIHFHGRHCMERQPERLPVPTGVFSVQSGRGISSHHHNPFVIICDHDAGEDHGSCYGYMLMYSGSHKTEIEKDQTGSVRLVTGVNNDEFRWKLTPGETFQTPAVIMTFSDKGLGKLTRKFHRIIRENVIDRKYLNSERPVLLNSWEACYMEFNDEKMLELADGAKDLGIEMVVMDDGWFGDRDSDNSGLGDWFVNLNKIKCGLPELVRKINDKGLRFGIWMEPEMISEDSDLYRAHPEWALTDPDRKPVMARNQLVLDMTREDVREYLFNCISEILSSANIEYVKWDNNRGLDNLYSNALPEDRQGEVSHRYVLGMYDLLGRVTKAFPDVMIEGCCGGGGRFDAGMLFYCPQIWCSDNTDAINRLKIQRGTAYGYPVSAIGSHVSESPNQLTWRHSPLETRAAVAMSGTFGYELDPSRLTEEEKEEIRQEIREYRIYRKVIQSGRYFRLNIGGADPSRFSAERLPSLDFQAWEFVSDDRSEAFVFVAALSVEANAPFQLIRPDGLDPDMTYHIAGTDVTVSGAALMYNGLRLDMMRGDFPIRRIHLIEHL